jgi:hypothetical protein
VRNERSRPPVAAFEGLLRERQCEIPHRKQSVPGCAILLLPKHGALASRPQIK